MKKIKTYSRDDNHLVCKVLEQLGYLMNFNCMWEKGYIKDGEQVIIELVTKQ